MKKIKKMRFGGMASSSKGPGGGMMGGLGSGGPLSKSYGSPRASSAPSGSKMGSYSSLSNQKMTPSRSSSRASASSAGKSSGRASSSSSYGKTANTSAGGNPRGNPHKYASGGIVKAPAKSYKDMRAGAGSGVGRIQKAKIAGRGR